MFLPTRCPLCATIGPAPCPPCASRFVPAPTVPPVAACTSIGACFRYDDAARSMMLAFKFRNRRDVVAFCARSLAAAACPVDLVTWAPSSAARVRARGFDQAEVLARATARVLGVAVGPSLRRRGTGHQTGLDAAARRVGPVFVPRARGLPGRSVRGRRVLLIDDIVTTGSTFAHAAAALRAGGATEVHALACCWTPPSSRRADAAAPPGAKEPIGPAAAEPPAWQADPT
jgi:ComF family protein